MILCHYTTLPALYSSTSKYLIPIANDAYLISPHQFAHALSDAINVETSVYEDIAKVCFENLAYRANLHKE